MNDQPVEDVEKFTCLGATVAEQGGGEEDMNVRNGKARRKTSREKQRSGSVKYHLNPYFFMNAKH